ncbi:hypothetical protein [Schumannella soli]|uniref:Uncharacterized protein n=1 Tax=Schumannella soli TaxID=2590779 RepID=A0A506Y4E7_9MICO|nr:hypothetical protein [Schumannella soli]TPW75898.1 hypothetical protein FJ657_08605 [Schumannella soli]
MASSGELKLPITGDNKDFLRATKGAADSAEDLADSLSDLGRAGSKELDRVTGSLDDISDHANILSKNWDGVARDAKSSARKQEDALERVAREAKETQQAAEKIGDGFDAARRETDRFKRDSTQALSRTSEVAAETKQEIASNLGEGLSSFRGDLADIPQLFQDTLGGLSSSIAPLAGPAGLIATVAGAAGLGLIAGAMEENGTQTEAFRGKVSSLIDALVEVGGTEPNIDFIADQLREMASNLDSGNSELGELYRNFRKSGTAGIQSFKDVALAVAGAGGDYDKLIKKNEDYLRNLRDENGIASAGGNAVKQANTEKIDSTLALINKLKEQQSVAEEAANAQKAYAQSGAAEMQKAAEIQASASDAIASGYDDIRQAAADAATAEDGAFDVSKYLSGVEAQKVAVVAFKENLAAMKLTPEEWENFFALDDTVQQNLAASFASGDTTLKAQIAASLDDAGSKSGASAAVKFDDSFKPKGSDVEVKVKTTGKADANDAIDAVAKKRDAEISVKTTGKAAAKDALDALAVTRTATINVQANVPSATSLRNNLQSAIDKAGPVTVRVTAQTREGTPIL